MECSIPFEIAEEEEVGLLVATDLAISIQLYEGVDRYLTNKEDARHCSSQRTWEDVQAAISQGFIGLILI